MRSRPTTLVAVGGAIALGASLAAVPSPVEARPAAATGAWCGTQPAPCVVAASRDGVPVLPSDPTWDVEVVARAAGGSSGAAFAVRRATGPDPYDLGSAERDRRWSVTVDLGAVVPRVTFGRARGLAVSRTTLPGGNHRVTVSGEPVRVTDEDECATTTWPWVCPERATDERQGYFGGEVTDYGSWTDRAQRDAMHGMDLSTNVGVTSIPPEVVVDPGTGLEELRLRMANQHEHPDGSLFRGFADVRIPNAFLREVYDVDDPGSLRPAGLVASLGAGSVSVRQEVGGAALLLAARGVTFSTRTLTLERGEVRPTKVRKVRTKRLSPHMVRVGYRKARSRGSSIERYVVRCKGVRTGHVVRTTDDAPRTRVDRLVISKAYRCKVRARSAAGPGPWSEAVKVKARPRLRLR